MVTGVKPVSPFAQDDVIDEISMVKSMTTNEHTSQIVCTPVVVFKAGRVWGLGSVMVLERKIRICGFVVLNVGLDSSRSLDCFGSGFLPVIIGVRISSSK